jgi:hypothetical protein
MRVCPKCGYADSPLWKPLFWKMYWEYMDMLDFVREYPSLADSWGVQDKVRQHKFCKDGNFYYDQEDDYFYYKFAGKTRKMVHRFPKGLESMANRRLFEKTPSEVGFQSPSQIRLLEVKE